MNIETEIQNWSDHVLSWLVTEEGTSLWFREIVMKEQLRRQTDQAPDYFILLTEVNLDPLFNKRTPNARQSSMLGIKHPLQHGWFKKLVGTSITLKTYKSVLDCNGKRPFGVPSKDWRNPVKSI